MRAIRHAPTDTSFYFRLLGHVTVKPWRYQAHYSNNGKKICIVTLDYAKNEYFIEGYPDAGRHSDIRAAVRAYQQLRTA